jgi:hypothetical protein
MSKFHFFTELYANGNPVTSSQNGGDAFGPIDDMNYRVCSLHNLPANTKAYAVCDGQLFVQAISDTNELVIVLKPSVQPKTIDLGYIKFIIYRNINASSLLDGSEIASAAKNDITKAIWDSFQKLVDQDPSIGTGDRPDISCLGISYAGNDKDPLENVFYHEDNEALFQVKGGWHIGDFAGGTKKAGIEFIVDTLGFEPKFGLTGQPDHKINITISLDTASNDSEKFWHWHQKEAVLQYLDPCSVYGALINEGIRLPEAKSSSDEIAPLADFDDVIAFFENRYKAYLVINNNHQRSYNYYNDFDYFGDGGYILLEKSKNQFPAIIPSSDNKVNYYNQWPLYTIEVDPSDPEKYYYFSIPLKYKPIRKGDTITTPRLYLQNGFFRGRSFSSYSAKQRLLIVDHEDGDESGQYVSKGISFTLGPKSDQGVFKFVPTYHKFIFHQYYFRIENRNSAQEIENSDLQKSFLNNIFPLNGMTLPLKRSNEEIASRIYHLNVITDFAFSEAGFRGVYKIGIAEDQHNYTFFAYPEDFHSSIKDLVKTPDILLTRRIKDVDFLYSLSEKSNYELSVGEVELAGHSRKILQYRKIHLSKELVTSGIDLDRLHAVVIPKDLLDGETGLINETIEELITDALFEHVEEGYLFYLAYSSAKYTLKNGYVAFTGNISIEFYDPGSGTFQTRALLPVKEVNMSTKN